MSGAIQLVPGMGCPNRKSRRSAVWAPCMRPQTGLYIRSRGWQPKRQQVGGNRAPEHRVHEGLRVGLAPEAEGGAPRKKKGGFFKKLLPIAKFAAGLIPGAGAVVRAGIDVAEKALTKPGVAGYDGLGALYAAPDGTVYQVQGLAAEDLDGLYADEELRGFAADEELRGFAADEELRGFAEDEELRGFAEDDELRGLDQDQELRGFAADEELRGLADDEELRGLDQGYVREAAVNGLEAYVPVQPAKTRWFVRPTETPEIWKPLW